MPSGVYKRNGHAVNFKDLTGQRFGKQVVLSWEGASVYRGRKG